MKKALHFGTDGIRGNADQFPFGHDDLVNIGIAIAEWSLVKYKNNNSKALTKVLIGGDTRISTTSIKKNIIEGLKKFPLEIVDTGIFTTPAICQLIQKNETFDFGIVISASHNPYQDNGIKILDSKTNKITDLDEKIISQNYDTIKNNKINLQENMLAKEIFWSEANEVYKKLLLSYFNTNFLTGLKIVLDCANGATYKIAPEIFKALGATVIEVATAPNGKNINNLSGALYPENIIPVIKNNKADIGFAFDGDGDRVIIVNNNGDIIDGDNILAILSEHPKYKNIKTIVGTVMTNLGLEIFLKNKKINLIRTQVGDKYIATELAKSNLLLGGETSGHIIIKDYMNSGDGIFTALRTIETIIHLKNWNFKTFNKKPQILINVPVETKKDLSLEPYSLIIKNKEKLLLDGRIVVRFSGTENYLRVMVEDSSSENATHIAKDLAKKLQEALIK